MALPWNTVLRVWDMFLFDGPKALFRVGLAIIIKKKSLIMKTCQSSSDVLGYLLTMPRELRDSDTFIKDCLSFGIKHKYLDKVRKQVIYAILDVKVQRAHESLEKIDRGSAAALA